MAASRRPRHGRIALTPVRRQYLKIKNSHPDAVVLFRLGDFYETFDDDAKLASRELEITLTSRTMGKNLKVPMAGVPAHSLEPYLARLIKKGHKVAICEQLTDPAKSKGLVERDVVRLVTPGTVLESSLLEQDANNYLASVVEDGEQVGLAYVDISTGEFSSTQLSVSRVKAELLRISPAEVLIPASDEIPGWLEKEAFAAGVIDDGVEGGLSCRVSHANAACFDLDLAAGALLNYYEIRTLESFGCDGLPLATRAAGAIVDYLAQNYRGAAPRLSALAVYSSETFMELDAQTRRNLELFQAGRWDNRQMSLFSSLDMSRTAMGGRLLRRWLGQPLLELEPLQQRLDAVEFFFTRALCRSRVRELLAGMADMERILGHIRTETVAPRELLALKSAVEAAGKLQAELEADNSAGVEWLHSQLSPVADVSSLIAQAINPEPSGALGEGNVIRPGFSAPLDELKLASSDARSFIASLEQKERDRTGIRNLKVGYNQVFGYYLEVSKANLAQVPEDYVRRQTLTNGERYIVPELKEYEALVLNARERVDELERSLFRQVCAQIANYAESIIRLAGAVACVDVFSSLAEVAVQQGYVRPDLDLGETLYIKNGRHPVVERNLGAGSFVPNDLTLSNEDTRLVVLTGPNMAGKSTYIRQAGIIVLMAQVGSFVPADEARIGLVDRIFTRVGLQDDLATGQSTFMVEMVETAAILNQATPRSLVILDEVGRGTSTYDGMSIARSVIEHLHNDPKLGCKSLFATHYHELTELANTLPGVRNFSVAVKEEDGRVVFLHRITPGGADRSYGVHVAQLAGLPRAVVNRAREVLEEMESNGRSEQGRSRPRKKEPAVQMSFFGAEQPLTDAVLSLDVANLTPLEAINKLYELQERARNDSRQATDI